MSQLHSHPKMEINSGLDSGHVIVDADAFLRAGGVVGLGQSDTPPEPTYTMAQVVAAIDAEPELTDAMPDEMWQAIKSDKSTAEEAMRIIVRETKTGIANRLRSRRTRTKGWRGMKRVVSPRWVTVTSSIWMCHGMYFTRSGHDAIQRTAAKEFRLNTGNACAPEDFQVHESDNEAQAAHAPDCAVNAGSKKEG